MNKLISIACVISGTLSIAASASLNPVQPYAAVHVQGKVSLERRDTIVPYYCTVNGCQHSVPYWVLVLRDRAHSYELNQPFNRGSADAPQSVDVNGVPISTGEEIALDANASLAVADWVFLDDVRNVVVIHDPNAPSPVPSPETVYEGWTCKTADSSDTLSVYADVWYVYDRDGQKANRMRVSAITVGPDGPVTKQIVAMDQVNVSEIKDQLAYDGNSPTQGTASLVIDHADEHFRDLPAALHLSLEYVGGETPQIPLDSLMAMTCIRTR
jgi:hypothetical protein